LIADFVGGNAFEFFALAVIAEHSKKTEKPAATTKLLPG